MTRILSAICCVFVLAAAVGCSNSSPSTPSSAGATITGTVSISASDAGTAATTSAVTVSIAGTARSANVGASGAFRLDGVPAGNVQLAFKNGDTTSNVSLSNVSEQEVIELEVALAAGTATIVNEVRQGKVILCHRTDGVGYQRIDVSTSAEPAHRAHGDARPFEFVPADPTKVFDHACNLIPAVAIKKFTNGHDADEAPGPSIRVGAPVTWTYVVRNNSLMPVTSLTVTDDRGVSITCPQTLPGPRSSVTCTATGTAVAGPYRNIGTVTATLNGRQYTDRDPSHYFGTPPGITIRKFTNGQHVEAAPGPTVSVGSTVTWTYVVTNNTAFTLTSLTVTDDQGVQVTCPSLLPPAGGSITCTGSGLAVAGQYHNEGRAVATSNGVQYTDRDDSFYFGGDTDKVQLCHKTGNGSYHLIDVSVSAEPAHRAHGDARPGEPVPGNPGKVFTPTCGLR